MRILVLSERYLPEIAAPCFRIADHARTWLDEGHEVTVVTCAPNFPRGKVFDGYKNKLYQEEMIDGVRVIRLWSYTAANEGVFKRTLDYLSFMFMAILFCWKYPRFDVCVATSGPFFTAVAGFFVSLFRRRPWIFEIRDLWPASVGAVGAMKGWPLRLCEKAELFLYRRAHRIVSLTNSFKQDLIDRGISADKNDVITNGVDVDKFQSDLSPSVARQRLNVSQDAFLLGYIGTIGMAHGLQTVLDAAEKCRDTPEVHIVLLGDGAERKTLEAKAKEMQLTNLSFHDYVQHDEIPSYLRALDMSIVHLKPDPLFRTVIPSKIFESMAVGTPILMAVEGESAEIVDSSEAGTCIPSGDSDIMADTIRRLCSDRNALQKMSIKGRDAVASRYSRRANALMFLTTLASAIGSYYSIQAPLPQIIPFPGPSAAEPAVSTASRREAA